MYCPRSAGLGRRALLGLWACCARTRTEPACHRSGTKWGVPPGRFMPVLGVGWYTDSLPRAGAAPAFAALLPAVVVSLACPVGPRSPSPSAELAAYFSLPPFPAAMAERPPSPIPEYGGNLRQPPGTTGVSCPQPPAWTYFSRSQPRFVATAPSSCGWTRDGSLSTMALASADSGLCFSPCASASTFLLPDAGTPEARLELSLTTCAEDHEVPNLVDDHKLLAAILARRSWRFGR